MVQIEIDEEKYKKIKALWERAGLKKYASAEEGISELIDYALDDAEETLKEITRAEKLVLKNS